MELFLVLSNSFRWKVVLTLELRLKKLLGIDKYVHIPELDGVRAIAVLMVFIYHAWGMSGGPILNLFGNDLSFLLSWGHPGVNLFYVLSGFLLFNPYAVNYYNADSPPNVKKYFIRRALRILPVYYVFLILNVLLTPNIALLSIDGLKKLLINFLFLQGLFPDQMINDVTWTLSNEVQFYIILPFIARYFVGRRSFIAFLVTVIVVITYRAICYFTYSPNTNAFDRNYYYLTEYNILGCIDNFAIGMILANILCLMKSGTHPPLIKIIKSTKYLVWLSPLVFSLLIYTYYTGVNKTNSYFSWYFFSFGFDFFLYLLYSMIFLYVLFYSNLFTKFLSNIYFRAIGIIGYSVYIWHLPIMRNLTTIHFISSVDGWERYVRLLSLSTLIVIPLSLFMFIFVEKYFMDLSYSLTKKNK